MRIRIVAVAIRPLRVVVSIIVVLAHGAGQIRFNIVNQGFLPLINKNGACRVQ